MSKAENISAIDKYIRKEMTAEEESIFQKRLIDDSELLEDYRYILHTKEALRKQVFDEKLEWLQKIESDLDSKKIDSLTSGINTAHSNKKKILSKRWIFLLVFLLTGLLIYIFLHNHQKKEPSMGQEMYANYFVPFPSDVNVVRGNDSLSHWFSAHSAYQQRLYSQSAFYFDRDWSLRRDSLSLFFAGLSYIQSDDTDQAVQRLAERSSNIETTPSDALWYYVLALIKAENWHEASNIMTYLINNRQEYNNGKSQQLHNSIKQQL